MTYEPEMNVNAAPDVDWDSWEEPKEFPPLPQPGKYNGVISQIRGTSRFTTQINGVASERINSNLDIAIRGGKEDGRTIAFQRVSNMEFARGEGGKKSSQMVDLFKSAGVQQPPRSNDDYERILAQLESRGTLFTFQLEWRGFCSTCYERGLESELGASSAEDAKDLARMPENKKTAREVAKRATKAKNHRGFPKVDGELQEYFSCPDCHSEIRAQANITRFLAQSVNGR